MLSSSSQDLEKNGCVSGSQERPEIQRREGRNEGGDLGAVCFGGSKEWHARESRLDGGVQRSGMIARLKGQCERSDGLPSGLLESRGRWWPGDAGWGEKSGRGERRERR